MYMQIGLPVTVLTVFTPSECIVGCFYEDLFQIQYGSK